MIKTKVGGILLQYTWDFSWLWKYKQKAGTMTKTMVSLLEKIKEGFYDKNQRRKERKNKCSIFMKLKSKEFCEKWRRSIIKSLCFIFLFLFFFKIFLSPVYMFAKNSRGKTLLPRTLHGAYYWLIGYCTTFSFLKYPSKHNGQTSFDDKNKGGEILPRLW